MNTSFERSARSDEWYTPRYIIDALGQFDLDPCAAPDPALHFASVNYTAADNGLALPWFGRVWLNPPYSHPIIDLFTERMVSHGVGTMITFNRMDTKLFQDWILPTASAIFILRGRVKFSNAPTGGGCGSVLIAFGLADAAALHDCSLDGFYIPLM